MQKLKKILALALVLALAFTLVGCDETPDSGSPAVDDTVALKVAIVTSPSGVDDGSFNQDNYNGILDFVKTYPNTVVKTINEKTGASDASVNAVADIIADYDVIITPGFQFAGIGALAAENPDKHFILVDAWPTDAAGNEVELDNVYAMQFAEQESGFFAGIAAAMETQTGKVAVVNGIAYPSNVNYQFGFESGVYYANKNLGTTAEIVELASYSGNDVNNVVVGGNYVGNFADPAAGKVVGAALIAEGVDVMLVAAGGSGNGVFTAAKEAGNVKVIGCDVDQYDDGVNGSDNIIITSVLKNMRINVLRQLNAIAEDKFEGGNVILYADTDSTGYISENGRNQLSAETLSALTDAYEQVKTGKVVPAANFNGVDPESFK